jgi:hypothetical protein
VLEGFPSCRVIIERERLEIKGFRGAANTDCCDA